jgi:hypothetical protein
MGDRDTGRAAGFYVDDGARITRGHSDVITLIGSEEFRTGNEANDIMLALPPNKQAYALAGVIESAAYRCVGQKPFYSGIPRRISRPFGASAALMGIVNKLNSRPMQRAVQRFWIATS